MKQKNEVRDKHDDVDDIYDDNVNDYINDNDNDEVNVGETK